MQRMESSEVGKTAAAFGVHWRQIRAALSFDCGCSNSLPNTACSGVNPLDDDDHVRISAMSMEGEVARANAMRITAQRALLSTDVQDKLKRALTRAPPAANRSKDYMSGSLAYFWEPRKSREAARS